MFRNGLLDKEKCHHVIIYASHGVGNPNIVIEHRSDKCIIPELCGVQEEKVDWLLNLTLRNGMFLMKISCRYRWHDVIN